MSHPSGLRQRAGATVTAITVVAILVMLALPASASAASRVACLNRTNTTYQALLACVTLEGVRAHQAALQKIAESNGDEFYPGTRAAGTEGYSDSVDYVAGLLRGAGYQVTLDPFEFEFEFPVILDQLTPVTGSYDNSPATNTGFGDVTGTVIPVDINLTSARNHECV